MTLVLFTIVSCLLCSSVVFDGRVNDLAREVKVQFEYKWPGSTKRGSFSPDYHEFKCALDSKEGHVLAEKDTLILLFDTRRKENRVYYSDMAKGEVHYFSFYHDGPHYSVKAHLPDTAYAKMGDEENSKAFFENVPKVLIGRFRSGKTDLLLDKTQYIHGVTDVNGGLIMMVLAWETGHYRTLFFEYLGIDLRDLKFESWLKNEADIIEEEHRFEGYYTSDFMERYAEMETMSCLLFYRVGDHFYAVKNSDAYAWFHEGRNAWTYDSYGEFLSMGLNKKRNMREGSLVGPMRPELIKSAKKNFHAFLAKFLVEKESGSYWIPGESEDAGFIAKLCFDKGYYVKSEEGGYVVGEEVKCP